MEQQPKKSLVFMEFYKIRKTKNSKSVLIFINEKTCISVSMKYLEKVIFSDEKPENNSDKESA